MSLITSAFITLVLGMCLSAASPAAAQNVKETTYVKRHGPMIVVRTIGPVEVVKVEPYIDPQKGKEAGRLGLQVVIKNTDREPHSYQLFGQGRTQTGGWLGGAVKAPSKGRLDPGKQTSARVRTSFEGKSIPKEIRLDVF